MPPYLTQKYFCKGDICLKKSAILLSFIMLFISLTCGCSGNTPSQTYGKHDSETTVGTTAQVTAVPTTAPANVEINKKYEYQTREIWCENNGDKIYGEAYIPITDGKSPLIITSHGLGANHESGVAYAKQYAKKGFAVYTFDFRGGSSENHENKSDGKSTDMSVMTEVSDLESVLETAKSWDFVDSSRIFLQGGSQGGLVSAITGVKHEDEISGLILLYPAFSMYDAVHNMFHSPDDAPESYKLSSIMVGKAFVKDLWYYDVREYLPDFEKNVIIIQGDSDNLVNVSVAENAAELYPNCELHILKGAGHGFHNEHFEQAVEYATQFLYNNI